MLRFIHTCDLLGLNYCKNFSVQANMKMDTQPTIELFSPCKIWPNSKCEGTHLVQYNPLFSELIHAIVDTLSQVWMDPDSLKLEPCKIPNKYRRWSALGEFHVFRTPKRLFFASGDSAPRKYVHGATEIQSCKVHENERKTRIQPNRWFDRVCLILVLQAQITVLVPRGFKCCWNYCRFIVDFNQWEEYTRTTRV